MSLSSTPVPGHAEQEDRLAAVSVPGAEPEPAAPGRHRFHRFPARQHALKVLYGDDEQATILRAAQIAGLRPEQLRRRRGADDGRTGPDRAAGSGG